MAIDPPPSKPPQRQKRQQRHPLQQLRQPPSPTSASHPFPIDTPENETKPTQMNPSSPSDIAQTPQHVDQ